MTPKASKVYHLFIVFSVINLLAFYLFVGHSVLDIHNEQKGFFDDELFNYYLSISILLVIVWFTYYSVRNRIKSSRLIWTHLFSAFITVVIVPLAISNFQNPMPRRYLDFSSGFDLFNFFGSMTWTFVIVAFLLLASEIFLLANLKPKLKD